MAWGLWRVPESRLRLLGGVRGLRLLELGCGAARWSIALARRGAHPTALDLSDGQLGRARDLQRTARVRFPLVRGSAERIPFADGVFDLVFSDWGAMTFGDPERTVPECARVLRRHGRLIFATGNPFGILAYDVRRDRMVPQLFRPYFGMHRIDLGREEPIEFRLPLGRWVELFGASGLVVERLLETRPDPAARTTYLSENGTRFGRSWPLESIWSVRKEGRTKGRPRRRPARAARVSAPGGR